MTGSIVHLVLAKIAEPDGRLPPGTGGISLFIVPKLLPEEAGGGRNDVVVAGLNHKMGYRGTPNCLLNFGEAGTGATGWLIGAPGDGLKIMFQMMNEARINVGLGAAALACRGHLLSRAYAAERRQGRPLDDRKARDPVPLNRHADVRRMLLAQKALSEGALALCLYSARLADLAVAADGTEARARAHALLDLLTPVTKSWPSEQGLVANQLAIQVHGGYGYTRDFDVEQLYRDNRLNPIHEGTTGIQGIDLLGRKILSDGLKSFLLLMEEMLTATEAAAAQPELAAMAAAHAAAREGLVRLVRREAARNEAPSVLANATSFLQAFSHLVVGWLWLDMTRAAFEARGTDDPLARGKFWACRYFFDFEMPLVTAWLAPFAARTAVTTEAPEDCL